ncbi:hypothetical protein VTI74DRAFT_1325 [Chaetomium olivicolor]
MEKNDKSDPFLWDEDRVVQELCTTDRSWKAPAAKKLPDPVALEARLRECGVDGESLLTYEDEFNYDDLWRYLGIKKLPHQLSLKDAITQFRRRSQRYREWKAQQLADRQSSHEDDGGLQIKPQSSRFADFGPSIQTDVVAEPIPENEERALGRVSENAEACHGVLSPAWSLSADRELRAPSDTHHISDIREEAREEPPSKKRRVAPTVISSETTGNTALSVIPTEADLFTRPASDTLMQVDGSSGFLGNGILLIDQLTGPQFADPADLAEKEFALVRTQVPPGRRIQVSGAMKRFFRSDRVERLRLSGNPRDETPLPLFGESDDEGVDSETWQEYQQEEEERLAMEAREKTAKDNTLSKDQVAELVRIAVQELESRWLAEKKPRYDRRAWKEWQDARRNPDRLMMISSMKKALDHLDLRIVQLTREIINQQWGAENEVERKASDYLEATVFDRKHLGWRIEVLESPRQPPKPSTLPRLAPKPTKVKPFNEDEEVLTSDSEDMDAFIEYNDDSIPAINDEMEIDLHPPSEQTAATATHERDDSAGRDKALVTDLLPSQATSSDEPVKNATSTHPQPAQPMQPTLTKIKTELPLAPVAPQRADTSAPEIIELSDSSPSPIKLFEEVPGFDDLESLEKIGKIGAAYWEQVKDGERLVVAVLSEWSHQRIRKIYGAVKDHDHRHVWAEYLEPIIENPNLAKADSVEFQLGLLLDVFASKTAKRVGRKSLVPNSAHRLKRFGGLFVDFHAHLRRILPLFLSVDSPTPATIVPQTPQKDGEGETRDPAEEPNTSDESALDDVPAPSTSKRRRGKRRDKNAQSLRLNQVKIDEELARRSREFHEKLAQQGSVPSYKARLIVNVTKESDEQSLIYINNHIGSKIMDYQIDGVRFMWNQVVVNSSARQGCLLAHTMGLGKTMQVITLLVVIAESAASPDESVRSQIPESLRESKTLILCPASLVDNWFEEIELWAPSGLLGPVQRVDAALSFSGRSKAIQSWASNGGVLIISYSRFTQLMKSEEIAKLLAECPNLVIGDEAHYMKNPESQRHQATANFKTTYRIAMTGSPLTNNVMDYYAMINWVAPNYLADIAEFRQRFETPIREGLYVESDPYQKRKARRMLHVLKATVEPKVHRRDIRVLFNELPTKKEFIITLPLTKVQMRLYQTYIEWARGPDSSQMAQARVWSLVDKLGLVLAHPKVFKKVAEAQKAKAGAIKAQSSNPTQPGKAGDGEEDALEMPPQDVMIQLLAAVAIREIEDYKLSNKIRVLLRILAECKKVKDKVLIFSQSIPTLDYIESVLSRQGIASRRLDGRTRVSNRQNMVKDFNADPLLDVYLISTKAGGVGLNIHGANRVVMFDFRYTPTDEQQAIGRAYRLGQTKPVYVYWLTIGGTFEDTIHNNAIFKTHLASRVVDKKNPDPQSTRVAAYFTMPREPAQEDLSAAYGHDKVLDALLNDGEIGKLIRKITSTETFEKEENFELTPEDQQEADKDIELEQLRIRNPEEYKLREQEYRCQELERVWQSSTISATAQTTQPRPVNALISPPTNISQHASPTIPQPTQSPIPVHGNIGVSPTASGPQPILGMGSHFKVPQTPAPMVSPSGASVLGSPSTVALVGPEALDFDLADLADVHVALCQEGRHVKCHPRELVDRVKKVLAQSQVQALPLMDKLQNLKRFSRNHRFAEAMLAGYFTPEQLACLTRLQMEAVSASLNNMNEAEFKQRVWTTKADLESIKGEAAAPTQRERVSRGVLRFLASGSDSQDAADTPPDTLETPPARPRAGGVPGNSAESPFVID